MNGQILGERYELQQLLGKKAGRRTLLVRDLVTQELVVVKLLSFSSDFEWDDLKLFEREAETLKSLSHPSIPRYLDYFEVNYPSIKGFALVQTYIPAQTLEQYIKNGRTFTEAELKQIASRLLEILIYLHGQNPPVIHRDIKPSNILLGDRSGNSVGQIYLVDFGSVQTVAAREGGTITVVGTYGYMPPEQFGGRTVPASDLYSLGATLIYLVTGTYPADLPQKDLRIEFEHAANISPALMDWLKWMCEPSLDKRLPSAGQALQALNEKLPRDISTTTIGKPIGTKVVLTKGANFLNILLPPTRVNDGIICLILFAIFWNASLPMVTWITVMAFLNGVPVLLVLLLLAFLWVGDFYILLGIIGSLFGRTRLAINPHELELSHELFGWKYKRSSRIQRQNISVVRMGYGYAGKRESVEIWAGTKVCSVSSKYDLSEPELEWLAQQLSSWLGIPTIRDILPYRAYNIHS